MIVTCEHCKVNKGDKEDMHLVSSKRLKELYKFANVLLPYSDKLLCDDCYTELRYYIADEIEDSSDSLSEVAI